jgi:DNA repair protein SbcD/Mre11
MKILHFADLHLGVETYGHLNPENGLSSRLDDFLKAFDQVVDFALENKIDLVLFCGDAYKTREPSQTQQRELARRIKRLSEGGIPLFLVTGNHDLPNAIGRATAIEIFNTLTVPNVTVADRPGIHRIRTPGGEIQIAALPWVRRSALLTREDTRNLDFNQINEKLQQTLTRIIYDQASRLDPSLPAILAAHVWVMNARVGTEKSMSIGQEHMLLLSSVAQPAFDYVALGHIHKGQVLNEQPPVVYSGSLERLDFGDEEDEKGFYVVDIEDTINHSPFEKGGLRGIFPDAKGLSPRKVTYQFQPINARRFFSLDIAIESQDLDPTNTVLKAIEANRDKIKDAVVRIDISLPAVLSNNLRDAEIRSRVKDAYYLTITKDLQRETRLRMGKGALEGISPDSALKTYLESKYPEERARVLLEHGQKLIREHLSSNTFRT